MNLQINIKELDGKKLYYYDNEWQKPVITEYQIFKLYYEQENIPTNYFAFPWATMIDNYNHKKNRNLYNFVSKYKIEPSEIPCFTVMQHIYYYKHLDIVSSIGITHVFTPHKDTGYEELEKKYNIKLISFSLFPAQSFDNTSNLINVLERKYLMSFIGQYNPSCYLTDIRDKIFKLLPNNETNFIKRRGEWHYESMVYRNKKETNINNEKEYIDNMLETKFSLCPSGSGPNSIRIWESISFGTIPIILADTLILPEIKNIVWSDYFIIWKESELDKLEKYLETLSDDKILSMSNNCINLYAEYFCPGKMNNLINKYFS